VPATGFSGCQARGTVNFRKRNSFQSRRTGDRLFASFSVSITFTSLVHLQFPLTAIGRQFSTSSHTRITWSLPRVLRECSPCQDDHSCATFDKGLLPAVRQVARNSEREAISEISPETAEIPAISSQFLPERADLSIILAEVLLDTAVS
jgi:hypothetical protein